MKEFAIRLKKGDDLKKSIESICNDNSFDTAIILSAVGSLISLKIRLAKAKDFIEVEEDFEIVSLIGTISKANAHLHISVSDELGSVVGGHLCEGTKVNTTVELVLGVLEEYESNRELDPSTGYKEVEFRKKGLL